jgi:excisionase family DNA binding protein
MSKESPVDVLAILERRHPVHRRHYASEAEPGGGEVRKHFSTVSLSDVADQIKDVWTLLESSQRSLAIAGEKPILLTVPQVARLLNRGRGRVYEMVRKHEITAIKDDCGRRGRVLIPRLAVDDWIKRKTRESSRW